MKIVLVSVLLAVVLTSTLVNTEEEIRERRQTAEQCRTKVETSLIPAIARLDPACSQNTCTSSCRSAIDFIRTELGCCLVKYGATDTSDIARLNLVYALCNLSPPDCSSTADNPILVSSTLGMFSSISAISVFSAVSYFMN